MPNSVPHGLMLGSKTFLELSKDLLKDKRNPHFHFADDVKVANVNQQRSIAAVNSHPRIWTRALNLAQCQRPLD